MFTTRTLSVWLLVIFACASMLMATPGCTKKPPPAEAPVELRVVCLVPSVTHMFVTLGRADAIVGVIRDDAAAPEHAAVVMGNDIDYEVLLQLRPTHVIISSGSNGIDPRLLRYRNDGVFVLVDYPYPRSLEETLLPLMVDEKAWPSVGDILQDHEAGLALATRVRGQLDAVSALCQTHAATLDRRVRVLVLSGLQSPGASGPGSVNDELIRLIGAVNAVGDARASWVLLEQGDIRAAHPDLVLLNESNGLVASDVRRALALDSHVRVGFLEDPLYNLPSVNMPTSTARMAQWVYPELGDALQAMLQRDDFETTPVESEE